MLRLIVKSPIGGLEMTVYHIEFSDRETIVDKMKIMADESGISVEQLIAASR
jgi:hypothetical protein